MSKYTTQVRFICETEYELTESKGFNDVDKIINGVWDKIFTTNFPIWDESYRKTLCCKILKHFYTREIGAETVGLWKLWLNTTMNEIMPIYLKIYETNLLDISPEYQSEYWRETSANMDTSNQSTSTTTSTEESSSETTSEGHTSSIGDNKIMYSDTPQGTLTNVDELKYLTNYTRTLDDTTGSSDNAVSTNDKSDGTVSGSTNSNGQEKRKGDEHYMYKNNRDYLESVEKMRNLVINVDMMIIEELEPLFLQLW